MYKDRRIRVIRGESSDLLYGSSSCKLGPKESDTDRFVIGTAGNDQVGGRTNCILGLVQEGHDSKTRDADGARGASDVDVQGIA